MKNLLIITQKADKNDQLLGFFIDWISRFAQKFDKVTVLCLERGQHGLPPNVEVISLGKDKGISKLGQLFNFYKFIFKHRKNYDAVFVHMNPLWVVLGGWYWHLTRKKIFFWYTSGGVTTKLKWAEKFADTIFTASSESFRLPSKKVIVTGHGIDTEFFRPTNNQQPTTNNKIKILSIGRIAEVKNYETLVRAAKILKDRNVEFSVTMIGEPALKKDRDYEQKLKSLVGELELRDNFNFLGKINYQNLVSYYQSHHLFIHLSKTGSLDKTLLEAMSCGMSVLSSNDAARRFLPAGLLFDENNIQELADKIEKIDKRNPNEQLRQYVVENHNLDGLVDKIAGLITDK